MGVSFQGKLWWSRMGRMGQRPWWILSNGIPVWRIIISACTWPIPRPPSSTTVSAVAPDGHQLRKKSRGDENAAKSMAPMDEVELWSRSVQGVEEGEERGE